MPEKANATPRATRHSLLLLRLVSSFNSDHRPEDLQQTEADEEQRAAREGELRKRTGLALRPARGIIEPECASALDATARRRGGRGLDAAAARTAG